MHVIDEGSLAANLSAAMDLLNTDDCCEVMTSRAGKVCRVLSPVGIVYPEPTHRVLLDATRDANPFFHLFESLWMLGGRNDVEFLKQFNSTIDQFSDNGETLHGAYGYRWRNHFGGDSLGAIINSLRFDQKDRRQVLPMWDPYVDPPVAQLGGKDVPCNTQAYFSVKGKALDLTVTNRSNDAIWGAFGANVVHMSMLLEYVSCATGIPIGSYYQFTNDLHIYERHWDFLDHLWRGDPYVMDHMDPSDAYVSAAPPLFFKPEEVDAFDRDNDHFLANPFDLQARYTTDFFKTVVDPLAIAYYFHKQGLHQSAMKKVDQCMALDWATAAAQWLQRRAK